jgi:tRNA(Ile)-lysidine synthase
MRKAVGAVRSQLEEHGLGRQSRVYADHGRHAPADAAPLLLVACSGGRDSLALAKVAGIVAGMNGLRCGAVIVDHQLQSGSATVAHRAAACCEKMGLSPVEVMTVDVTTATRGTVSEGVEAAAREARYGALVSAAQRLKAAAVLIAHTQDDQVETVLIGLARTSSPAAFAGMPREFSRDGITFLRPLMDLTRADTTAICQQNGLSWWDDPTNGDGSHIPQDQLPLRSRIRQTLVPVLHSVVGQAVSQHLADAADSLRADQEYLDAVAVKAFAQVTLAESGESESGDSESAKRESRKHESGDRKSGDREPIAGHRVVLRLDCEGLEKLAAPIRTRVIVAALRSIGAEPTRSHLERIDTLVTQWHGQSPVCLSSGFSVIRQKHVIELCQDRTHANS